MQNQTKLNEANDEKLPGQSSSEFQVDASLEKNVTRSTKPIAKDNLRETTTSEKSNDERSSSQMIESERFTTSNTDNEFEERLCRDALEDHGMSEGQVASDAEADVGDISSARSSVSNQESSPTSDISLPMSNCQPQLSNSVVAAKD